MSYDCYKKELKPHAQKLRREMTKEERRLWYDFLRDLPVPVKRQKIIGGYIADFYIPSAKLIIELDGSQHYSDEGITYDRERSAVLERYGLKVIRFSNRQVDREFYAVCQVIDEEVRKRCGDAPPVSLR